MDRSLIMPFMTRQLAILPDQQSVAAVFARCGCFRGVVYLESDKEHLQSDV